MGEHPLWSKTIASDPERIVSIRERIVANAEWMLSHREMIVSGSQETLWKRKRMLSGGETIVSELKGIGWEAGIL